MGNDRQRSSYPETPAHVLESIQHHMAGINLSLFAHGAMLSDILDRLRAIHEPAPGSMTSAEVVGALTPAVERLEGVGATPPEPPKP